MRREELTELHYIAPVTTVPSILLHGILSHDRAARLPHHDISLKDVQDLRATREVVHGYFVHSYANLYFNARNAMMFKRQELHHELCVLRVDPKIVDFPYTVIADQNAGSRYVRFYASPGGLAVIDADIVMADSWMHGDDRETWRHKSKMCAEVLVHDAVPPHLIMGAYVSNPESRGTLLAQAPNLPVALHPKLFFQRQVAP